MPHDSGDRSHAVQWSDSALWSVRREQEKKQKGKKGVLVEGPVGGV